MNGMSFVDLSPSADRLLRDTCVHQRLSGAGLARLLPTYADLVDNQDKRLAAGESTSQIPLLWRALAETVGLTVDNDGRIVDGPCSAVPGL